MSSNSQMMQKTAPQLLRMVLKKICTQTQTLNLTVKWTLKRLFNSILARPAAAGRGFLKAHDLCGLVLYDSND
jgi:hypothetical protein